MFDPHKNNIEVTDKTNKRQEYQKKYLGHIRYKLGHKIYSMDKDGTLREEKATNYVEKERVIFIGPIPKKIIDKSLQVEHKKDRVYCSALNEKNARRKLEKLVHILQTNG